MQFCELDQFIPESNLIIMKFVVYLNDFKQKIFREIYPGIAMQFVANFFFHKKLHSFFYKKVVYKKVYIAQSMIYIEN